MTTIEPIIQKLGKSLLFKKNEFLFHAHDPADGFFYILSGEVRVFKMDAKGREIEIIRLGPKDYFGEAVAFASRIFPAYACAVQESQVLFFSKKLIFERIDKDPALARFFIRLLAEKCITLNKRIEMLGLLTVKQRLIHYLLAHCSESERCSFDLPVTKKELAKSLGTISETLSRTLRQLQNQDLIDVAGNRVHIKNCCALRSEFD